MKKEININNFKVEFNIDENSGSVYKALKQWSDLIQESKINERTEDRIILIKKLLNATNKK
jgi:hypothetical protein